MKVRTPEGGSPLSGEKKAGAGRTPRPAPRIQLSKITPWLHDEKRREDSRALAARQDQTQRFSRQLSLVTQYVLEKVNSGRERSFAAAIDSIAEPSHFLAASGLDWGRLKTAGSVY
jgi:hypothetical protein